MAGDSGLDRLRRDEQLTSNPVAFVGAAPTEEAKTLVGVGVGVGEIDFTTATLTLQ